MIPISYIIPEDMPPLELRQGICLFEVALINDLPNHLQMPITVTEAYFAIYTFS